MRSVMFQRFAMWSLAICVIGVVGCSEDTKKAAEETLSDAKDDATKLAGKAEDEASKMGDKAKDAMKNLSEEAMGFLKPIKEQLGDLGSLKDKPAELKEAVSKILETIESKAESIPLPEGVKTTVATVKEKLTSLKDYLAGDETDPEKTADHIKQVEDAAKGLN